MKFYVIVTNALDNDIKVFGDEFKDEQAVWDYLEETSHNFDNCLVLNQEQAVELFRELVQIGFVERINLKV